MPYLRTVLALAVAAALPLLALAQDSKPKSDPSESAARPLALPKEEPVPPPATEAETALDEAIARVGALKSVAADVRETVSILDQQFGVEGRFVRAPGNLLSLRLTIEGLGEVTATTLQVSDGKTLWDYAKVLDDQSCRRVSLAPILERLENPALDPNLKRQMIEGFGFGGPDALLLGLRRSFAFNQKQEGVLKVVGADGQSRDVPVWILRGSWKDRKLLNDAGLALPATGPLPSLIPSVAAVWVGREDGWPYQLKLEGQLPPLVAEDKPGADSGEAPTPTSIVLTYSNVELAPEVSAADFAFEPPPNVQVLDDTEVLSNTLDQAIAAAQANADAPAEPVLDGSLSAPGPASDSTAPATSRP